MARSPRRLLRIGLAAATLGVVAAAFWFALRSSVAATMPGHASSFVQQVWDSRTPVPLVVAWALAMERATGDASLAQQTFLAQHDAPIQAITPTVSLGLHSHLVSGIASGPEPIQLRLVRAGAVLTSKTVVPFPDTGNGFFYATPFYDTPDYQYPGMSSLFLRGDILEVTQAGQSISLTIPTLIALAEQITGTVYGRTEPNASVDIYFYKNANPNVAYWHPATATTTGAYSANLTARTAVAARDYGHVFHTDPAGNRVYVRYNVPFLRVGIGQNVIDGMLTPLTWASAINSRNSTNVRCVANASNSEGAFAGCFIPEAQVGDTILVTAQVWFPSVQVVSITVAAISARPDPMRDTVSGEAPPGATVRVDLYNDRPGDSCKPTAPTDQPSYTVWATASSTGTYTADFTGVADLVPGNFGFATVTDSLGYQTFRRFFVPFLQAYLGSYQLLGLVNTSGDVTVTISAADGVAKTIRSVRTLDGCFADNAYNSQPQILPGDRITVTDPAGAALTLTMPALSASINPTRRIVSGQAPPYSPMRVGLGMRSTQAQRQDGAIVQFGFYGFPSYYYTATTTSTAAGTYAVSFGPNVPIWDRMQGAVFNTSPGGHEACLRFEVSLPRLAHSFYVPIVLK